MFLGVIRDVRSRTRLKNMFESLRRAHAEKQARQRQARQRVLDEVILARADCASFFSSQSIEIPFQ